MKTDVFFVLRTFNKDRSYGGPEEVWHYPTEEKLLQQVEYLRVNSPEKKILGAYRRTITITDKELPIV